MNTVVSALKSRLPSARKVWLNIHLWLGLTAGFVLALIGLTGSLLVINGPILEMQFGNIFNVEGPVSENADIDEWIANARRSYSDIQAVGFVVGPGFGPTGGNTGLLGVDVADKKLAFVTINPDTRLPLGKFLYLDSYSSVLIAIHARLAAPASWISLWQNHSCMGRYRYGRFDGYGVIPVVAA